MMASWRILSMWFYLCFLNIVFNRIVKSESGTSRVCYSTAQTVCEKHILQCQEGELITIDAASYRYFNRTDYTKCTCGNTNCDKCSGESVEIDTSLSYVIPHRDVDYWKLVSGCSFKRQCSVPVPLQQIDTSNQSAINASYSYIRYLCIKEKDVVNFCNGTKSGTKFSILYNKSSNKSKCRCSIEASDGRGNGDYYTIKSLDIRNISSNGGGFFNLSFASGIETHNIKNENVRSNEGIFKVGLEQESVTKINLIEGLMSPDRIWIFVNGRRNELQVTCQPDIGETTTATIASVQTTASTTTTKTTVSIQSTVVSTATEMTASILSTALTTATEATVSIQSTVSTKASEATASVQSTTAVAAGGVIGGIVVIATIAMLITFCKKRKRSTERLNKRKKTNMNMKLNEDETISSDFTPEGARVHDTNNLSSRSKAKQPTYFQLELQPMNPNYMTVDVSGNEGYDNLAMTANPKSHQAAKDIYNHLTESAEEECYNHLKTDANQRPHLNVDYDTTASASKAVKDLENQDDYYSYDHLGASKVTAVTENNYDTTHPRVLNTK